MPTNDFLPFAAGGGADVIDQATYAALAARLTGFEVGIAEPLELNKVWRQSAWVSSEFMQFVAEQSGLDALDDGSTGTIKARIFAAVQAVAFASARPLVILQDQKTQNTAGGTFSSGAWRTRDLNTKVLDTGSICSLSSNQFTLPAGTYVCFGKAPAVNVDPHQARLWNATDSAVLLTGSSENASGSGSTDFIQTSSVIAGSFVLSGTKTLQLQHQCAVSQSTNGFGFACNFGPEVYSYLEIRKIA